MDLKYVLKRHIAPVVLAGSITGSVLATTHLVVKAEEEQKSIVIENDEKTKVSDFFDTKKEAEKWINDRVKILGAVYEITDTKIYTCENAIVEMKKYCIDEVYHTKEEALKDLKKLEAKAHSSDLVINEIKEIIKTINKVDVNKNFETKEELEAYKKIIQEKDKSKLIVTEIPGKWVEGSEEKVCDLTADSEEELDNKIENVKKEIKMSEDESNLYDIRIEENNSEILIPSTISEEKFSKTFSTEEEIQSFINEKMEELKDDKDKIYEFSEIENRKETNIFDISPINEVFDSMDELNNYIESQKSNDYLFSDIQIIEEVITETITKENLTIKDLIKLDALSHYEVEGNYIILKLKDDNVYVWTLDTLSDNEKELFKSLILENSYDESLTSETEFVFMSQNDLNSDILPKITYTEGLITIDTDSENISHLNYGNYERKEINEEKEVQKYRLTANKYKEETNTVYDLNYILKTQQYESKTAFSKTVYKTLKTKKNSYNLIGTYEETKEEIDVTYNLKGKVVIPQKKNKYKAEIKYRYYKDKNDEICSEEENPKTSDESNINIYSSLLIGSVAGLIMCSQGVSKVKKIKNKVKK